MRQQVTRRTTKEKGQVKRTLPSSAMSEAGVSECAGGGCGMGATYGGGTSVCASASFVPASCRLLTARPASACNRATGWDASGREGRRSGNVSRLCDRSWDIWKRAA